MKNQKQTFDRAVKFEAVQPEGKPKTLTGTAILFNDLSSPIAFMNKKPVFVRIGQNAMRYPKERDVLALANHDKKTPLARMGAGTLQLTKTELGIDFEFSLVDGVSYAEDLWKNIKAGVVKGMSFTAVDITFTETVEADRVILEYTDFELDEITVTVDPSYLNTTVSAFSKTDAQNENEDISLQIAQTAAIMMIDICEDSEGAQPPKE